MILRAFFEGIITDYEFHAFVYKLVGPILTSIVTVATIIAIAIAFASRDTLRKWRKPALILLLPFFILSVLGVANAVTQRFSINEPTDEGMIYIGRLDNNGRPDGFIKEFDQDLHIVYIGDYKNGKRHGKGTIYKTEEIDGQQITYASYRGEFKNGKRHGEGMTYTYAGGETRQQYEGQFAQDEASDSEAVFYVYTDEGALYSSYEGGWSEGSRCGYGLYKRFDEEGECVFRYQGTLWDGNYHGRGILEFLEAETMKKYVYVGLFEAGDFNGNGVIYDESGNYVEGGLYKDDVLSGDENEALTDDYPFPVDCLWQEYAS